MMHFDDLTQWQPGPDGRLAATIPETWLQGRTAFGGLITAAGARALQAEVGELPLRSVGARFLGPVPAGPAWMETEVLRRGRSVVHAVARVGAGDDLCSIVDATFGASRPSALSVAPPSMPDVRGPDPSAALSFIKGVTPDFTQHVAMQFIDAPFPFSGSDQALAAGWCRHRTRAGGPWGVIGLLDAWPGPVLALGSTPFFASTVHLTAHLVAPEAPPSDAWLYYRAEAVSCAEGYATTRAHLWDADGQLIAWTEQLLAVYDAR